MKNQKVNATLFKKKKKQLERFYLPRVNLLPSIQPAPDYSKPYDLPSTSKHGDIPESGNNPWPKPNY